MTGRRFVVASASPRRKEILKNAGFEFEVIPSDANEGLEPGISAKQAVLELAKRKAFSVLPSVQGAVVLGCDTVVTVDGEILGKPADKADAFRILKMLSGRRHAVCTGVCITDGEKTEAFVSSTEVEFYDLSDETIESYIATGEPADKAGAYGIQGFGNVLVKKIDGDYSTVVGLPLSECVRVLARFDVYGKVILRKNQQNESGTGNSAGF